MLAVLLPHSSKQQKGAAEILVAGTKFQKQRLYLLICSYLGKENITPIKRAVAFTSSLPSLATVPG